MSKRDEPLKDYQDREAEPERTPTVVLPQQTEFFKSPRRFGSIPVDELPLGCDKEKQYYVAYPRIGLPFQRVERISFGHASLEPNRLIWGDNLHVMRSLPSESVDLIYIDPPFFSGKQYNVIFGDQNEIRSFSDVWEAGMPGYLVWLNARLLEMKRLLKKTGSIYVHLDWHAAHYVKVEMDKIFGYDNFRNEIIWHYGGWAQKLDASFSWKYDTILFYSRTASPKFFSYALPWTSKGEYVKIRKQKIRVDDDGREYVLSDAGGGNRVKRFLDEAMQYGQPVDSVWEIPRINNSDKKERIGYPTQKPEALLERLIMSCTDKNDVVADFFCGGGTTPAVAQKKMRRWIACDISRVAVSITIDRVAKVAMTESGSVQSTLGPVPDFATDYWGFYEVPALTRLSQEDFRRFIVQAYDGRVATGEGLIHGYKQGIPLHVGPASQTTAIRKDDVIAFAQEITTKRGKRQGIMLAWAFSPSAQLAAEKLSLQEEIEVDFIKLQLVPIESNEFKEHVVSRHREYSNLVRFILPPVVRLRYKRLGALAYEFDISESTTLNVDSKIINVQWDFDFQGTFSSTLGYSFMRGNNNEPILRTSYEFPSTGFRKIACRVQDDLGGEKMHVEDMDVR